MTQMSSGQEPADKVGPPSNRGHPPAAHLEGVIRGAREQRSAVAGDREAGDVVVGRVRAMQGAPAAADVAPVLLAQHLRLGRQHLAHGRRGAKLACGREPKVTESPKTNETRSSTSWPFQKPSTMLSPANTGDLVLPVEM